MRWRQAARWPAAGYWALAGALLALYGAWPGRLWGEPHDLGQFSLGLLWAPPSTDPEVYYRHGDRPWFAEYHWHGIELLTGNAFLLGGLAVLAILIAAAIRTRITIPRITIPRITIPRSTTLRSVAPTSPPHPTTPSDLTSPTGPTSPASPTRQAPSARTRS